MLVVVVAQLRHKLEWCGHSHPADDRWRGHVAFAALFSSIVTVCHF